MNYKKSDGYPYKQDYCDMDDECDNHEMPYM
jgi:hypothetical protein